LYGDIQSITNLRQIVAGTKQRRKEKKMKMKRPQAPSSKLQATSSKLQARLSKTAIKIHEDWAYQNGYRLQAPSSKLQGPRYRGSDYLSVKRQAD